MKFSFIVVSIVFAFLNIFNHPAAASDNKLRLVTDKGTVYEQPCPNEEGVFEIYFTEDGKRYSSVGRCYATVRFELGAWLPIWKQGIMPTGGISGGIQLRLEPGWSLHFGGGFGGWHDSDELNGITWYASATARIHVLDDVLRLGVGLGLDQQHLELDTKLQNFTGGGVLEIEVEAAHHLVVNGQLLLGEGGLYNQPPEFSWVFNLGVGYRF